MGFLTNIFSKTAQNHFETDDMERIVEAIRQSEKTTSGEIRVFVESRCKFVDPVNRAAELFFGLEMDETHDRNGVLVYVAMRDHQFAIFADEGIYKAMGKDYWNQEASLMLQSFKRESYADGLITIIRDIGLALKDHFPYDASTDRNELPDEIIFGK